MAENAGILWVVVPIFLLLIGTLLFQRIREGPHGRRRARAFEALAKELSLNHIADEGGGPTSRLDALLPFMALETWTTRCRNVLRGSYRGTSVECLDVHAARKSGPGETTSKGSGVVVVHLPQSMPASITILRERRAHRFFKVLGVKEVETGDSRFDAAYWVHSKDSAAALSVLGPGLREYLLNTPGPTVQVRGALVCTWLSNRLFHPRELGMQLDRLVGIADRIPRGPGQANEEKLAGSPPLDLASTVQPRSALPP